ncbi:hypothetical protein [Caballeronia sp. GAWG2-1]|uniref:immunity protein Imm33 domain-containing protein n=1 Tax=Caballeronia sp. GAWG2-1 TaxID=2921744 RepID=UPI0020282986|nr:hypothetical protein [Caballeronia sp. GAWG2-1]
MSEDIRETQRKMCVKFNAAYFGCDLSLKVGIYRNVKDGLRPLNGLRLQPEGGTCGWYIWAGDKFSDAPDFFVPLHATHIEDWAPLIIPYLGLPPGWRFIVTEHYDDVWEDPHLLAK